MNCTDAIKFLNDDKTTAAHRFEVLTGFNSLTQVKPQGSKSWVKALSEAGIIQSLGMREIAAYDDSAWLVKNAWSMVVRAASAATGTGGPEVELKSAYKQATIANGDQTKNQEAYIKQIIDLLTKYQNEPKLTNFSFDEPSALVPNISGAKRKLSV